MGESKEIKRDFEKFKKAELISLNPQNIRDLPENPSVYAIYKNDRPLYVGSTGNLFLRLADLLNLIRFRHTFCWRLFIKAVEGAIRHYLTKKELEKVWDESDEREKLVGKVETLLRSCLFKYCEVRNLEKARRLENCCNEKLNPENPHLKYAPVMAELR